MKTVIIIDDEPLARDLVREYIHEINNLQIIGEYPDGFSGLKAIHELKPDLIFLDIQMPKLNGFEMLELLEEKPEIIFTTAFDHYALKAFELNAVDYLLKPFSFERFKEAVLKALSRIDTGKTASQELGNLQRHLESKAESITRIVVKSRNSIVVLPLQQIYYIEAQDDYVMIYTDNARYLKQRTMQFYEDHLNADEFMRIHRSYIVRIDLISKIETYEKTSYIAILKDGRKLPVSRRGHSRLKDRLDF